MVKFDQIANNGDKEMRQKAIKLAKDLGMDADFIHHLETCRHSDLMLRLEGLKRLA